MLPLITIFGTTISSSDLWAGLLALSAPIIITVCCVIARGRKGKACGWSTDPDSGLAVCRGCGTVAPGQVEGPKQG